MFSPVVPSQRSGSFCAVGHARRLASAERRPAAGGAARRRAAARRRSRGAPDDAPFGHGSASPTGRHTLRSRIMRRGAQSSATRSNRTRRAVHLHAVAACALALRDARRRQLDLRRRRAPRALERRPTLTAQRERRRRRELRGEEPEGQRRRGQRATPDARCRWPRRARRSRTPHHERDRRTAIGGRSSRHVLRHVERRIPGEEAARNQLEADVRRPASPATLPAAECA